MEPVNVLWSLPLEGEVKINVHSYFSEEPLANGNVSDIGIVIRNHRGRILRMLAGTLGIRERRLNELYAMLEGLKRAFLEDRFDIVLETDHEDSYWEWRNATELGVLPEHRYVVQQLTQRRADSNFNLTVRPIQANANLLAAYLARHGEENWEQMVILAGPVGHVFELWCNDMGLGPNGSRFMAVHELDLMANVVENAPDAVIAEVDEDGVQMDEEVLAQEML